MTASSDTQYVCEKGQIMLMNPLQDRLDRLHRDEMMRKAEKGRSIKDLPYANRKPELYAPMLARVGKALSTMGDNLQERYGKLDKQPVPLESFWADTV
jgi:hypothetical protein